MVPRTDLSSGSSGRAALGGRRKKKNHQSGSSSSSSSSSGSGSSSNSLNVPHSKPGSIVCFVDEDCRSPVRANPVPSACCHWVLIGCSWYVPAPRRTQQTHWRPARAISYGTAHRPAGDTRCILMPCAKRGVLLPPRRVIYCMPRNSASHRWCCQVRSGACACAVARVHTALRAHTHAHTHTHTYTHTHTLPGANRQSARWKHSP